MEMETLVRFTGHPHPFLVERRYCNNPGCACNEVWLTFREVATTSGEPLKPLAFRARVDLETWQERDAPSRPARIADWMQEFLEECPAEKRDEFRAEFQEAKRVARRLAEFRIPPSDVVSGTLVSFPEVVEEQGAISRGGQAYTFSFHHQGREYLVEDHYCPNPECECRNVHLQFWECNRQSLEDEESFEVSFALIGSVHFDREELEIMDRACPLAEAEDVLSACWEKHRADSPMFEHRYRQVKEIGRHSLAAVEDTTMAAHPPSLHLDRRNDDGPAKGPAIRVGRNDPCPCGSGKKYKKCCARNAVGS